MLKRKLTQTGEKSPFPSIGVKMTEIEKAAMLLRRALSEKELAGEIKESDALRLIESLYEAERLLVK